MKNWHQLKTVCRWNPASAKRCLPAKSLSEQDFTLRARGMFSDHYRKFRSQRGNVSRKIHRSVMTSQWLKNILRHQVEQIFIFHIRSCLTKIGKKSPITIRVVFFSLQEMGIF